MILMIFGQKSDQNWTKKGGNLVKFLKSNQDVYFVFQNSSFAQNFMSSEANADIFGQKNKFFSNFGQKLDQNGPKMVKMGKFQKSKISLFCILILYIHAKFHVK